MADDIYYYQLHPFFNKDAKMWFDKIPKDIVNIYPELRDIAAGKSPVWVAMIWFMHRSPESNDNPNNFFNDIRKEIIQYYQMMDRYSYQRIILNGNGYPMDTSDNVGGQWEKCNITWDGMYLKSKWDKSNVEARVRSGAGGSGSGNGLIPSGYISIRQLLWPLRMKGGNQLFINWPLRPPIL